MRTMTQLVLVLMGGTAVTAGAAVSLESGRACREAQAHSDPRAGQICRTAPGGGGGHVSGGGWHGGWFGGGGSTGVRSVSRGGFGFAGLHFGGFHG